MMLRKLAGLAPVAILSATVVACGGNDGPDVAKVRQDFNSPSGSINDKEALIGATGNRNASNAAIVVAGGGVPGGSLSYSKGLSQVAPGRLFGNKLDTVAARYFAKGLVRGNQAGPDFSFGSGGCADSEEIQAAFTSAYTDLASNASSSGASGEASFEIDVGACSMDVSGTIKGNVLIDARVNGGQSTVTFRITQTFVNVCETAGQKSCVDGTMVFDAQASGDSMGAGSFDIVTAWELTASWDEGMGGRVEATTKGGIKYGGFTDGMGGQVNVQYLLYAKDSKGTEVSFVLEIEVVGNEMGGTVTWRYRGSDGTAECTINSDGSGSCSGNVSWTGEEYDAQLAKK